MHYLVSYSAVNTWRDCPKSYEYQYLIGLRPRVEPRPFALGSLLHTYLEHFYKSLKAGKNPAEAYLAGVEAVHGERDKIAGYIETARVAGQEEIAKELSEIIPMTLRIANRYHQTRGMEDARLYDVLAVEQRIEYPLLTDGDDTVITPAVIDLIVRNRETRQLEMWDHKSAGQIPKDGTRLRDLQLLLYSVILMEKYNLQIDKVVWNYLRTSEPTAPKLLQNGTLSRAKSSDSSALVYLEAIREHGFSPNDYADMLEYYADRERTVFFPRHSQPVMLQSEQILLGDMVYSAEQMIAAQKEFAQTGQFKGAVRNVGFRCNFCKFAPLCTAAITGGDEDSIANRLFIKRQEKKEEIKDLPYSPTAPNIFTGE